jgi:Bacterial Ig domain/Carboxypeptidase regulatory-like domain/FG-GAP-like repeat/Beta-propeller repeat
MKKAVFIVSILIFTAIVGGLIFQSSKQISPEQTQIQAQPETAQTAEAGIRQKQKIVQDYGKLPINFEPNVGQTDGAVKFLARGQGYSLFLTDTQAVLALQKRGKTKAQDKNAVVRMQIEGANAAPKASGLDQTEGKSNYFIGNNPEKWQTEVPNFRQVKYEQIYSGIDLVYYGNGQQLEYDFLVQPNANPDQIKLKFDGIKSAKIDRKSGDLLLETGAGTIRQHKPLVYQNIDGERKEIASSYKLEKDSVSFNLARYDKSKELIIDPILAYGSYLGGNLFDEGRAITVDTAGNAYIVGTAASRNFPTTAGTIKPAILPSNNNQILYDAFVTKVNPNGTAIVFSTYFGGNNGYETGTGVAVDGQGNVFISGLTMSNDLPMVNAYSSTYTNIDTNFAAKLNPTGSAIVYSTYLGTSTGTGSKIAVNPTTGEAVFAGTTGTPNFPTTPGAYKEKLCDTPASCQGIFFSGSYIVKFNPTGGAIFSTLFPAALNDVALDTADNVAVGGTAAANFPTTPGAFQPVSSGGVEGLVAKLNSAGNSLVFATFLGGGLQSDRVKGVAVDSTGNVYATGQTQNTGFPTTAGAFDQTFNGGEDGFLTKFNPTGSALVYSTFFGGAGKDEPFAVGLGTDDSAFVAGETLSGASFPLKNSLTGTNGTIFVTRFNPTASALVFSTLLGQGGAYDLAVDGANAAYVTGHTTSIVVTPDSFQPMKGEATATSSSKDAFVLKLAPTDETIQAYSISGTVTDPTQFGNYQPIIVTLSGTVNRSVILPYGSGNGVIPYYFGNLPAGGNYVVRVKKIGFATEPESVAFNNLGANQFADFTILNNQEPVGVITSPAHGTTYNAPATITITATASDPDGHAIEKVDFVAYNSDVGSVNLGTDTTAPYEFTWTNVPQGTWALYAMPTDSLGLRGDSTPVVHVFVVDSTGLSVSITSPTEGQTFVQGDNVPLSAAVSSSTAILEFYDQNNNLVGRRTSAPWSTTWRITETGNYTVKAKVFNSQGQSVTSDPVNLVVNPINHRITGRILDLTANAPVPNITLNLTSATNPNITATTTTDSNGNYTFTDLGATADDSIKITPVSADYTFYPDVINISYLGYINRENENFWATRITQINVALTSPTQGQTFTAPATIDLAADATSGAGTITKVDFYRRNGAQNVLVGTDETAPFAAQATNVAAGNQYYFARATDSTGAVKDSAEVSVQVVTAPSTVTLLGDITDSAGFGMQGVRVFLTGTANGNQINQTSVTGYFGTYGFSVPVGGNYTITPEAIGTQSFTPPSFTVNNATQDNIDIDFVANAPNQSPSVTINSPTDGATYTMPAVIPVNVTATDADGSVAHLTVSAVDSQMSTTIGQSNNGTFNAPWQPTRPGNYRIWATARDNGGRQTSVFIDITVNAPGPVSISGRIVNRDSEPIAGVTVEMRNYPVDEENPQTPITATTDANGNYTIPNVTTFRNYILKATSIDHTFSPQQRLFFNLAASQSNADFTGTLQVQRSDFDGDGQSDMAVWRPSTGVWYVNRSTDQTYTALQFGGESFGDVAVPGNFDGDKKTDYAVFRGGIWYIMNSSNGQTKSVQFGFATDKPVAGDYDGDGKTDIAVWRPETGTWYIQRSSDASYDIRQFGLNGDVPLAGDYDGDGMMDLTVWRPSNGVWYVLQSSDGNARSYQFGVNGDTPLVGDFDGDKKTDYTIFRPSTGVWYVNLSSNGGFKILQWGISTDVPVPGDFDRDGKTDFAIFRKSEGNWYVFKSSTNSYIIRQFGLNGDMPIPAAYR